MEHSKSFERAVFDGDILGPEGVVVNEFGQVLEPGTQNFGHTRHGRNVCLREANRQVISSVIDFQTIEEADPRPMSQTQYWYEDGQVWEVGSVY